MVGRLPVTPGGSDYQAYYDDQLNITWATNANIDGAMNWDDANNWAASLTIGGVDGWRLPSMDVNTDTTVVNCSSVTQAVCADNEFGHLFYYGEGTTKGSGITFENPEPFSDVQSDYYWSGTDFPGNSAHVFHLGTGFQTAVNEGWSEFAWAVHSGDVSPVPLPGAVWLFGSAFLGLAFLKKRRANS